MPRLSHARLSYVHFLTSLLNRRLSHHFAWERFKNPRLKSRHRRKRINYNEEIGIDASILSSVLPPRRSYFYLFGPREKTIKFHGKNDNFTWLMADLIDLSMPLFFHGIYRVGTRILHRGWSNENKDPAWRCIRGPSLQRCVAYYTYTRISRLPDCRGLVGWRGGFVMGDGVGAGTPLLACVYAFTCYVANDLCIPLITSMHCTVLSGDHSFIRPTCALRYCQRQKHRRRTIRAGCVKCATFTDCAID